VDVVVFLFTDIEGSTEKWEKYRGEMKRVLVRHDRILYEEIERHGGRVVKHTGDGVFAVFEGGDPLRAAVAIQHRFRGEDWGEVGELRVRIGLHAGLAERRGDDYFGPVVNRTARVMAAAWGGQILLTGEVLREASVPVGVEVRDHGLHLLKDLEEPIAIYELVTGLYGEFPAIRSLSSHPTNLTPQPTPFLDREKELKEIGEIIDDPSCRLLTLVGPGGVGKTRLALQVGAERIDRFRHGVYYVPLASLTLASTQFLVFTIADSIRFSFYSREDPKLQLLSYLREKEMLLILDNFEHLVEEAAFLAEILKKAAMVKLLVTSQERLNLKGEWVYEVRGMDYPQRPEAELGNYGAPALFLEGARRVDPDFQIKPDDIPHLIRICRLVGGLPLGIELASAWIRSLSLAEIADEIERTIDFLTASVRDIPERHQSLRAVFEQSWERLAERERLHYMRLSVFRGGFGREAAETVAKMRLPDLLSLIDKSFLRRDHSGRYQMLEIIRQYGYEHLKSHPDEWRKTKDAHCRYYADFINKKEEGLIGRRGKEVMDEIGLEIENLRSAWEWAVTNDRYDELDLMNFGLALFYSRKSRHEEGVKIFKPAVEKLRGVPSQKLLFAQLSLHLGQMYFYTAQFDKAISLIEESLNIARIEKDEKIVADCFVCLGNVANIQSRYEEAQRYFTQARDIFRRIGDNFGVARATHNLGIVTEIMGRYEEARACFQEALKIVEQLGDPITSANILNSLGVVADRLGQYQEAKMKYLRSLEIMAGMGYLRGMVPALNNLGMIAVLQKNYDEAEGYMKRCLQICEEIGDERGKADIIGSLAELAEKKGNLERAIKLYHEGLKIMERIGDERGIVYAFIGLGDINLKLERYKDAQRFYKQALKKANQIQTIPVIMEVLSKIVELYHRIGETEQAIQIAGVVLNHPATDEETKERIRTLFDSVPEVDHTALRSIIGELLQ